MSADARRLVLPVAVATLLAAALAARASPASTRASCPPRGSRVVVRDRQARVYESDRHLYVACLVGRRSHPVTVGHAGATCCRGASAPQDVRLAGTMLAYLTSTFGVDSGETTLTVVDVASRRVLRRSTVGHYSDAGLLGAERVTDLALAANGSVAWISAEHGPGPAGGREAFAVHAAGPSGAPVVLDEGEAIGESSLALSGATLSWSDGGARRSARMP